MEENNKISFFMIGLGVGLLGGFLAAFLLTPKSGQQTRDLIADRMSDVGDRVKEYTASREKVYKDTWKKPRLKPYSAEYGEVSEKKN